MTRRVVYLHGFASGPQSRKARFFGERLSGLGFDVAVPDLAEGNFEGLTITRQLRVIEGAAGDDPTILIGSSMGGYLAALYAARRPQVERVVLMAPAFGFARRWTASLPEDEVRAWRETGARLVYHYGEQRECRIGWELIEDAMRYEDYPEVRQPAVIFHGDADDVVPYRFSEEFAAGRSNVRLVRMESGHELTDVLAPMWEECRSFLPAPAPAMPGR